MRAFVLQVNGPAHTLLVDEEAYQNETTFEAHVLECLARIYPRYRCVVFGGVFTRDLDARHADLAIISKDFSHWFVIEVELLSHSLRGHVLPQVRTIRYGDLALESAVVLSREMSIEVEAAKTLIDRVPRATGVISNGYNHEWALALSAIDVQYLSILPFAAKSGIKGYEIQGDLEISRISIGFGIYDAVASAVRMLAEVDLPSGALQIEGPDGVLSEWTAMREAGRMWLLKAGARLDCQNRAYVQIVRALGGKLTLRV